MEFHWFKPFNINKNNHTASHTRKFKNLGVIQICGCESPPHEKSIVLEFFLTIKGEQYAGFQYGLKYLSYKFVNALKSR